MEDQLEKGAGSMQIDPSTLKNILRLLNFYLSNSNYTEQQGTKCFNWFKKKMKEKIVAYMYYSPEEAAKFKGSSN